MTYYTEESVMVRVGLPKRLWSRIPSPPLCVKQRPPLGLKEAYYKIVKKWVWWVLSLLFSWDLWVDPFELDHHPGRVPFNWPNPTLAQNTEILRTQKLKLLREIGGII